MNYFSESGSFESEIKKNFDKTNMSMGTGAERYSQTSGATPCQGEMMGTGMMGCCTTPIYECPQERVCHRYICHEVPHVMPCNTRIINHHVYRHTFTPCYSCCEENVCENVYEPRCY